MTPPAGQRWTRKRPTEPGWYWFRGCPDLNPMVVWVSTTGGICECAKLFNPDSSVDLMDGEWQGPLTPNEVTE